MRTLRFQFSVKMQRLPLAFRIAFLLLVALNMTLVCQGRIEGNQRVGAHLIVFKEPPLVGETASSYFLRQQRLATYLSPAASPSPAAVHASLSESSSYLLHMLAGEASSGASAINNTPACTVQPLSGLPLETGGANMPGIVVLSGIAPDTRPTVLIASLRAVWATRLAVGPDVPPPRFPLPVL